MFELSTKCFQSIWEDFARGQLCLMSNFSLCICVHIDVSDVTELMGEFCEYVFRVLNCLLKSLCIRIFQTSHFINFFVSISFNKFHFFNSFYQIYLKKYLIYFRTHIKQIQQIFALCWRRRRKSPILRCTRSLRL